MIHPCDKLCGNKTASGYCATTACINPQYSNIGTAQYGQGVQKRIITNADRIRSMTDEELAEFMCHNVSNGTVNCAFCGAAEFCRMGHNGWLDWLKQEVSANDS